MSQMHEKFSIAKFSISVVVQLAILLAVFRFALPGLWATQLAAGVPALIACFLGTHLFLCFFEWVFHRYVLHSITAPWLQMFAQAHRNHHGLTVIKLERVEGSPDRFVLNRYPITDEDQFEDSAFPPYALVAFWLIFTPLLGLVQFLLPTAPVMLGGFLGIAWSMTLYEVFHAIEHYPYEWWKRATEHPRWGFIWKRIYGFHHMHHANVSCNEAISGFFSLPLADWAFGTYHQPRELLLQGRMATAKDFAVPNPPGWVAALDAWARKQESKIQRAMK